MAGANAGSVIISNTFQSGTPASAAEVNQNFTDIKTAVDDNDSRIGTNEASIGNNASAISVNVAAIGAVRQGLSVYDNSVRLGALLSIDYNFNIVSVLLDSGYMETIYLSGELNNTLYYTTTDCTGQAYIGYTSSSIPSTFLNSLLGHGYVLSTSNTNGLEKVYIAATTNTVAITYGSSLNADICNSVVDLKSPYVIGKPVQPNDFNVTGATTNYSGPITIGY